MTTMIVTSIICGTVYFLNGLKYKAAIAKEEQETRRCEIEKEKYMAQQFETGLICQRKSVSASLVDALRVFFPKNLEYIEQDDVNELRKYLARRKKT